MSHTKFDYFYNSFFEAKSWLFLDFFQANLALFATNSYLKIRDKAFLLQPEELSSGFRKSLLGKFGNFWGVCGGDFSTIGTTNL